MSTYDELFNSISSAITTLVKNSALNAKDAAIQAGQDFLNKAKNDLETWTNELAKNELTMDEFKDLIESKKDLAEMAGLEQAGESMITISKFKSDLVNTVVGTVATIVLKK